MATDPDAHRWLAYAEEDWSYGQLGVNRFPRAAAWSFQQAAEKSLKAWLIHKGTVPPRTHDLVVLLNLTGAVDTSEILPAILLLAEITATARYPDDTEPVDEVLATEYGVASRVIVDHVRAAISRGNSEG